MNNGKVSIDRIKQLLSYDKDTGVFMRKIPVRNCPAGVPLECKDGSGAIRIMLDGVRFLAHRLAWVYVHDEWPEDEIDHKNLNRADNRISNLRKADRSQNQRNIPMISSNTSGHKGVSWEKSSGRWKACVQHRGRIHIQYFSEKDDAAEFAAFIREITHGEFCNNRIDAKLAELQS